MRRIMVLGLVALIAVAMPNAATAAPIDEPGVLGSDFLLPPDSSAHWCFETAAGNMRVEASTLPSRGGETTSMHLLAVSGPTDTPYAARLQEDPKEWLMWVTELPEHELAVNYTVEAGWYCADLGVTRTPDTALPSAKTDPSAWKYIHLLIRYQPPEAL